MKSILIIEPDQILNSIYSKSLVNCGHTVYSAETIERAIQILDEIKIDLVITEIQIAMHNGLEFIYEMRSYPEWQSIPIIINSFVETSKLSAGESLSHLNVAAVFYKPKVSLAALCDIVDQHLLLTSQ